MTEEAVLAKSLQSCPTLYNPMDCILPDPSVYGILQARILEWFVISSSRRSYQPRDQTHVSYVSCIGRRTFFFFFTTVPPAMPLFLWNGICA